MNVYLIYAVTSPQTYIA